MTRASADVAAIAKLFEDAHVDGFIHARNGESGPDVGRGEDEPVIAASVFKLPVLVELFDRADRGLIRLDERVEIDVLERAPGPTGLSILRHPIGISWRDLAASMIVVSDNAATDVICARLGLDSINATMQRLGCAHTRLVTNCRGIFQEAYEDTGIALDGDLPDGWREEDVSGARVLDPAQANATTPEDMTHLLQMLWNDRAASPASCAEMRLILGLQVWPHRLASGFPESAFATAGKTGTLFCWRNEVGVVTDRSTGAWFPVACFTRSEVHTWKHPAADAAIGMAARVAVDALRTSATPTHTDE